MTEEVRLADSTCEAGEQSGTSRGGAGGGKQGDREECGTAKHGPNAEPGSRAHLLRGNRDIFVTALAVSSRAASGRPEAVADDERSHCFRRSIPCLYVPLSTLRVLPHGSVPRMTRGQRGSLLLHCDGLARLPPAGLPAHRGSITNPTQLLCTLRGRRYRRLTQHSLPGGPLWPYPGRSFTGWTAPAFVGAFRKLG